MSKSKLLDDLRECVNSAPEWESKLITITNRIETYTPEQKEQLQEELKECSTWPFHSSLAIRSAIVLGVAVYKPPETDKVKPIYLDLNHFQSFKKSMPGEIKPKKD